MVEAKLATEYDELKVEPFWTKKMRTLFRRLDTRAHGFICLNDLLNVATDVLSAFSHTDTYKGDQVVNSVVTIWYDIICTNVDAKDRTHAIVNEAYFVENILKASSKNGDLRTKFTDLLVVPFFVAADEDDDKKITGLQFKNLLRSWTAPDTSLDLIFRLVDTSKHGKITQEQYEHIFAEWFFNELPRSKTSQLFGNLVSHKRPEDFGQLDFNPYWEGKMRTMFRRFDVTNCSKLRCRDFIQIARNIAHRGRLDKKRANTVLHSMLNVWVKYIAIDSEGRHIAEVTEKEFLHNLRLLINGEYRHEIDQFGWTFFKAMEIDGNGFVTLQEYRNLQEAWGVEREEAEGMFKTLDADKDNKLTSDEFLSGWVDYFLGEDSSSQYKGFFGPVISKFEVR